MSLKIEILEYKEDVYDITVEGNHNFYANDILVHNCVEITLPSTPMTRDDSAEIALCTLAAFNLGEISVEELPELSGLLVEALDNLLDYQNYPMKEAENATVNRRTLGIGVTNYAYWLAKNGAKYSDGSGNNMTHLMFEAIMYNLMKASVGLAKERGACPLFNETKYAQGIMPVDLYKKDVDEAVTVELQCGWDQLREDVLKYGMRNSTLMAQMPCESSSAVTNSTNGIEPPRQLVVVKDSSDGLIKQTLPDVYNLQEQYETAWQIKDNTGYLTLTGIMQKFIDQAISVNGYYDPKNYPGERVPMQVLLKDMIHWYKMGNKTAYYMNTRDGNDQDDDDSCAGGACKL